MTDRVVTTEGMTPQEIEERVAVIRQRNGKRGYGDLSQPGADRAFLLSLRDRESAQLESWLANLEDQLDRIHKDLDRTMLARRLLAGGKDAPARRSHG